MKKLNIKAHSIVLVLLAFFMADPLYAATSKLCPGEEGYNYTNFRIRNPQTGGFVSWTASVTESDSLVIAPTAAVCGYAIVRDSAQIMGKAIVRGDAHVDGRATITGDVVVEGNAVISGSSVIRGRGTISSGVHKDVTRTLNDATSTGTSLKPYDAFGKLNDYLKRYASSFHESDAFSDIGTSVRQEITFDGNPCKIVLKKTHRPDSCRGAVSSSHGSSQTSFNMKDVYNSLVTDSSPTFSVVNFLMKDYKGKATRRYDYPCSSSSYEVDWTNSMFHRYVNTVETVTASSHAHAAKLSELVNDLAKACRQQQ